MTVDVDATARAHPPLGYYERRRAQAVTAGEVPALPTFNGQTLTAPLAAAFAGESLREAGSDGCPADRAAVLLAVAEQWRLLAVALAQHLPLTPRPADETRR